VLLLLWHCYSWPIYCYLGRYLLWLVIIWIGFIVPLFTLPSCYIVVVNSLLFGFIYLLYYSSLFITVIYLLTLDYITLCGHRITHTVLLFVVSWIIVLYLWFILVIYIVLHLPYCYCWHYLDCCYPICSLIVYIWIVVHCCYSLFAILRIYLYLVCPLQLCTFIWLLPIVVPLDFIICVHCTLYIWIIVIYYTHCQFPLCLVCYLTHYIVLHLLLLLHLLVCYLLQLYYCCYVTLVI